MTDVTIAKMESQFARVAFLIDLDDKSFAFSALSADLFAATTDSFADIADSSALRVLLSKQLSL